MKAGHTTPEAPSFRMKALEKDWEQSLFISLFEAKKLAILLGAGLKGRSAQIPGKSILSFTLLL